MSSNRMSRLRKGWALALCLAGAFLLFGIGPARALAEGRPDSVALERVNAFGGLQKAPVFFPHDRHTSAPAPGMRDCVACHARMEKGLPDFSYLGIKTEGAALEGKALMDAWHRSCSACHAALSRAGEPAGPLETDMCAKCHNPSPGVQPVFTSGRMDEDAHTDHILSGLVPGPDGGDNCMVCHHAVKGADGKPAAWQPGAEGACSDCHTASSEVTLKAASHASCLSCHSTAAAGAEARPPLACVDCHGS